MQMTAIISMRAVLSSLSCVSSASALAGTGFGALTGVVGDYLRQLTVFVLPDRGAQHEAESATSATVNRVPMPPRTGTIFRVSKAAAAAKYGALLDVDERLKGIDQAAWRQLGERVERVQTDFFGIAMHVEQSPRIRFARANRLQHAMCIAIVPKVSFEDGKRSHDAGPATQFPFGLHRQTVDVIARETHRPLLAIIQIRKKLCDSDEADTING